MNRNAVVTVLVIIVIAGVAALYLMMNRSSSAPAMVENEAAPSSNILTEKTSLKEFMGMAGTQKCEFNDPEKGNKGSVFIDSGKMRGDFTSEAAGKVNSTHMINNGSDVYVWMDDQQTGFKTSLKAIEEMGSAEGQTGMNQTVDINKQVDYKCEGWTVDQTKFAVPAEVKFQDMAAMMQGMQNMNHSGMPEMKDDAKLNACKACDNLSGTQKDQCKTALKCN